MRLMKEFIRRNDFAFFLGAFLLAFAIIIGIFLATHHSPTLEHRVHLVTVHDVRCVVATRGKDIQGISCDWKHK